VLSALTFVSTFLGGAVALRTRGSLRCFFAFSAGTLLAIALVDLLPEAVAGCAGAPAHRAAVFYVGLLGLAFFVGHFLDVAASDLIPEMHRGDRSWRVVAVHLAGVLLIVVLTRLLS